MEETSEKYPTPDEINALPDKVRAYIRDLETRFGVHEQAQVMAQIEGTRELRPFWKGIGIILFGFLIEIAAEFLKVLLHYGSREVISFWGLQMLTIKEVLSLAFPAFMLVVVIGALAVKSEKLKIDTEFQVMCLIIGIILAGLFGPLIEICN